MRQPRSCSGSASWHGLRNTALVLFLDENSDQKRLTKITKNVTAETVELNTVDCAKTNFAITILSFEGLKTPTFNHKIYKEASGDNYFSRSTHNLANIRESTSTLPYEDAFKLIATQKVCH